MRISRCECFEFQPEDRDYNAKGKPRNPQMKVFGGGISYALRTAHVYGLLIWEEEDEGDEGMELHPKRDRR